MGLLIGREREQEVLRAALESQDSELVAIYGRRRVGKTFLVREMFDGAIDFELVGVHGASRNEQLSNFARARGARFANGMELAPPADWQEAFSQLAGDLTRLPKRKTKRVLFFDELPWLDSRRSGFLRAFEHFWNSWASHHGVLLVTCGSAAAWMIRKLLRARGGLHNRVTRRIRLEPFTLGEAREFFASRRIDLGDYQTLELYMAMGGIPHYLKEVCRGRSATQNIDSICFAREGLLKDEFRNLYSSLFEHPDRHESVVRALAKRVSGLTRNELLAATRLQSGGTISSVLEELEESGFVTQVPGFGKRAKDSVYRLADEYSLFYLSWIERHRGAADGFWLTRRTSPAWRAWSGLAFEGVCLRHVPQLKKALGIAAVETIESAWRHKPTMQNEDGAQVDLVIDRKDATMNLCEMKFSDAEFVIDKRYAAELRRKRDAFRRATGTKKILLFTLVTTYGVRKGQYRDELVAQSVTMDALFARA